MTDADSNLSPDERAAIDAERAAFDAAAEKFRDAGDINGVTRSLISDILHARVVAPLIAELKSRGYQIDEAQP